MEKDIFFLMHSIMKKISVIANRKLFPYGITNTEMQLLNVLYFFGTPSCNQNLFIEKVGIDRSNVGRGLMRLDKLGYINREKSEDDKRAYRVSLTQRGNDVKDELMEIRKDIQETFLKEVDPEEYESMMKLLAQIDENLVEQEFFTYL